jgi:putative membrane protein
MGSFLADWYLWTKSLHVISVIALKAIMFYLPRLSVYLAEQVERGSPTDAMFQMMERRLLRAIINPAMVATWLFGLCLVFTPGIVDWHEIWPWTKAATVLVMSWFHGWLSRERKNFISGEKIKSGRTYRMMNELPTLLMIVIVISVITRFA